jgi:hypothetical protein
MKTREEWINHWLDKLAGIALTGLIHDGDERPKGPLAAGAYALKLPEKIATLLDQMYVWLETESPLTPRSVQNGQKQTGDRQQRPASG